MAILENSGGGYLHKHSMLGAVLAQQVVGQLKWGSKTQREAICFILYFHDICIPKDHLAEINSAKQFKDANLNQEDKKIVESHALKASELLSNMPKVPFGTVEVILQHHGMANGIGFSETLSSRVSPLACVFHVVEEVVDAILHTPQGKSFNLGFTMNELSQRFNKGHYLEAMEAIKMLKL